jgi:hypothetical protein
LLEVGLSTKPWQRLGWGHQSMCCMSDAMPWAQGVAALAHAWMRILFTGAGAALAQGGQTLH